MQSIHTLSVVHFVKHVTDTANVLQAGRFQQEEKIRNEFDIAPFAESN